MCQVSEGDALKLQSHLAKTGLICNLVWLFLRETPSENAPQYQYSYEISADFGAGRDVEAASLRTKARSRVVLATRTSFPQQQLLGQHGRPFWHHLRFAWPGKSELRCCSVRGFGGTRRSPGGSSRRSSAQCRAGSPAGCSGSPPCSGRGRSGSVPAWSPR